MATLTKVFEEARALPSRSRARLISKLLAVDMPNLMTEEKDLAQREDDIRRGRVRRIEVLETMKEARAIAGMGGTPPVLKKRRR
jgi:hypothetical protein